MNQKSEGRARRVPVARIVLAAFASFFLAPGAAAHAPGPGAFHTDCAGIELEDESIFTFDNPVEEETESTTTATVAGETVRVAIRVNATNGTYYLASDLSAHRETNALVTPFGTYEFPGLQTHSHQCTAKTTPDGQSIPNTEWVVYTIEADAAHEFVTVTYGIPI